MMQTIALIANGDPQYQIQTPTRVGETERGKYLVYDKAQTTSARWNSINPTNILYNRQ